MSKIKTIYSIKELHNLLENHINKEKLIIYFDIDLTIVYDNGNNSDEIIEPEITKQLFKYILDNRISFSFITARFHDTVCVKKRRNLKEIKENIEESIFPILEELGIDTSSHKDENLDDEFHPIKNEKGKCVGILYRGIFFSGNKGETIKYYRKEFKLEKIQPHIIFIDDLDRYLKGVLRHNPEALALRREIEFE